MTAVNANPSIEQRAVLTKEALKQSLPLIRLEHGAAWAIMYHGLLSVYNGDISLFRKENHEEALSIEHVLTPVLDEAHEWFDETAAHWISNGPRDAVLSWVIRNNLDLTFRRIFESVPKKIAKNVLSSHLDSLLGRQAHYKEERIKMLSLAIDIGVIPGTPKRANQAMINGDVELACAIKKPTLTTCKDFFESNSYGLTIENTAFYRNFLRKIIDAEPSGSKLEQLENFFNPNSMALLTRLNSDIFQDLFLMAMKLPSVRASFLKEPVKKDKSWIHTAFQVVNDPETLKIVIDSVPENSLQMLFKATSASFDSRNSPDIPVPLMEYLLIEGAPQESIDFLLSKGAPHPSPDCLQECVDILKKYNRAYLIEKIVLAKSRCEAMELALDSRETQNKRLARRL